MNIEINNTKDELILVNWDNVTHVSRPENYLMGQVGDLGEYLQINFTNKKYVYTKDTVEKIKERLNQ